MRLLALVLLAAAAHGATITTAPGFTIGPVTFSNVTYTNTASVGLPFMGFSFTPGSYPEQDFGTAAVLWVASTYGLDPTNLTQSVSVSETLSADFTVNSGYAVTQAAFLAAFFNGDVASSVSLTAPCSAKTFENGPSFCKAQQGAQSGTVSITVEMSANACTEGPTRCHSSAVNLAHVRLELQAVSNPEPRTWGLALIALSTFAAGRRLRSRCRSRDKQLESTRPSC